MTGRDVSRLEHHTADVTRFVDQVRQYRAFVERASELPLEARLATARRRLLELYLAGSALPDIDPDDDDDDAEHSGATPPGWPGFEGHELYWEVFDPYRDDGVVSTTLSDDVLDVYLDVGRGLARWDRGWTGSAIWEWRLFFDRHWGDHAIDALRALHRACRQP